MGRYYYRGKTMFKNYVLTALRNIKKQKAFSIINIAGLAIGMVVCILILLWVMDELSYDRYHENADRIYRLYTDANIGSHLRAPVTMAPAAPAMVSEYPEVLDAVRFGRPTRVAVQVENRQFQEDNVCYADNSIFNIFSFSLIKGDPESALKTPYTVVLTEDIAQKYFGEEDPVGKIIKIGGENEFAVTGVVKNVPHNSHFTFTMLRSFETLNRENSQNMENWLSIGFYTYLLLAENTNPREIEKKFSSLIDEHLGHILGALGGTLTLALQPLTSIHLYSDFELDISTNGDITYIYLFSSIALFVLLIACFNFINLATARSSTRAKEIGMRKTFGADRGKLVVQFLGESIIYCVFSLILALLLLEVSLPLFNSLVGRELTLNILQIPSLLGGFVGLTLLTGFISGSYPAFFLSSFHPVRVLKGNEKSGVSNKRFRNFLVIVQFSISIILIIGTITVYHQLYYMKNKKLGFNKEHVVVIPGMSDSMQQSYLSIKGELERLSGIVGVGGSDMIPGKGIRKSLFLPEGFSEDQAQTMDFLNIDHHFIPTMGMELAAGRNFSADLATDTSESVIINETAVEKFGWDEPIGKTFIFRPTPGTEGETTIMNVIGVVKDFHMTSLRRKIDPLLIFYSLDGLSSFVIRISPENIMSSMELLEKKWKEIDSERSFDYYFLDESFDSQYGAEERLGNITLYFNLLAIFIGCLGLFGLAAFTAEERTKEIGIRKVLGASMVSIIGLLNKEFIKLVVIANIIAWPFAWYGLRLWLQNFAYRINLGWSTFFLAGVLALVVALITVTYQSIKAATANPVDSLRYE